MKYKVGDKLGHIHIRGLSITIDTVYPTMETYYGAFSYSDPDADILENGVSTGRRLYEKDELESPPWELIKSKEHEYKYSICDYFVMKADNTPFRIVALYDGFYYIQMFFSTSRPIFSTSEEVINNAAVMVPLLPTAASGEGTDR